ncbi:putative uncharacterized protein C6orf183 isoform X1 [Eschrichtius robustus]|uniref:putative uncharacterized protein C6orf183 isoform X1 n=1 Tax=Eschrichtius robustus TaxID=9764 RepID=UPI0035C1C46C
MQTMDESYKIVSTERIQVLEKELAVQLTELKSEIEKHGTLQGSTHRAYSSVRMPKDISYFRRERELALKKTLQVAESKPLVIQADVMQRELESCLRREYTPENLPLLLLQYYTERITQLAQSKYLHMLRWKRFCHHSKIMEQLYPFYKALQYLPISKVLSVAVDEVPKVGQENETVPVNDIDSDIQGSASPGSMNTSVSGPTRTEAAFFLPQHTTETEDLKPQLRFLLSHFCIPYDMEELRDASKEIEHFSLVLYGLFLNTNIGVHKRKY